MVKRILLAGGLALLVTGTAFAGQDEKETTKQPEPAPKAETAKKKVGNPVVLMETSMGNK